MEGLRSLPIHLLPSDGVVMTKWKAALPKSTWPGSNVPSVTSCADPCPAIFKTLRYQIAGRLCNQIIINGTVVNLRHVYLCGWSGRINKCIKNWVDHFSSDLRGRRKGAKTFDQSVSWPTQIKMDFSLWIPNVKGYRTRVMLILEKNNFNNLWIAFSQPRKGS